MERTRGFRDFASLMGEKTIKINRGETNNANCRKICSYSKSMRKKSI